MITSNTVLRLVALGATFISSALASSTAVAQHDPGVRGGAAGAGGPIAGLNGEQQRFFAAAKGRFTKVDGVSDGLGPRFNLDSCAGCHAQPAVGGTSPSSNPEIGVAGKAGARNAIPPFITPNGPAREVRFKSDGGVHDLFVITGRSDAPGCHIAQPDFSDADNIIFRIPTPVFGAGLISNVPDETLIDDAEAVGELRSALHIGGHFQHERNGSDPEFNHSGNDGTITRFGWKAQNKSPSIFAGEAYNVEMGVTNELFPNKREDDPSCQFNPLPEDYVDTGSTAQISDAMSDVTAFGAFMTLLAAPTPAAETPSSANGRKIFENIGCAACHIASHTTARSIFSGLSRVTFFPYSDFQLHDMGKGLADGITQADATGNEFRTAPLWGIGQRIFFLHDGRTSDLLQAIREHKSAGSEASKVIDNFNALSAAQQQDLLDFLRGL
jgi:CxxC motif-containing protein (DUF1111 family)